MFHPLQASMPSIVGIINLLILCAWSKYLDVSDSIKFNLLCLNFKTVEPSPSLDCNVIFSTLHQVKRRIPFEVHLHKTSHHCMFCCLCSFYWDTHLAMDWNAISAHFQQRNWKVASCHFILCSSSNSKDTHTRAHAHTHTLNRKS